MEGRGRRVVVTGIGVVAPCGIGKQAFWEGLLRPVTEIGATRGVADFDPNPWFDNPKEARRADRFQQFALAAAAAAVVLLEEYESARARGARILGEILGAASNADAHHITAPSPGGTGAVTCMELCLADAGLEPGDIRQINAHGTSTPLNDAAEADAITKVFGKPG